MSNYFLFTADCHIKARTWTNSTLLKGDAYQALTKAARTAAPKTDTIVIGGDLFDSNRPSSNDVVSTVSLLRYNFAYIYYIRGNHDSADPSYLEAISEYDFREAEEADVMNFQVVSELPHTCFVYPGAAEKASYGYAIAGISWDPSDSKLYQELQMLVDTWRGSSGYNKDAILYIVLHCSFKHLLGFDGAYQLDVDMIRNICGEDHINILVGHIHTRSTVVYNSVGAYIHSPGSTYPLSTDKMNEPCFASLIEWSTGKITDIPTDVRKYVSVNLSDVEDGDVLKWLGASDKQPLEGYLPTFVQLVIPENYDQPLPVLESDKYVFKVIRSIGTPVVQTVSSNNVYTIEDAVREELSDLEDDQEMAIDMAEQLLAADDPVALLDEWLDYWKVRRSN